jgi:sec-independent protein translocase protein TatC
MFVVGAILTPPDVASQIMMAAPLIALYEIGIIVAKIATKKKAEGEETELEEAKE